MIYVEANVNIMYAENQLHSEKIFEYLFKKVSFMSLWQPIKFSDLDKIQIKLRGLLNKHVCK